MAEFVTDMKKTHSCGELRGSDLGSQVVLMGWVHSHRNLGGCVFVEGASGQASISLEDPAGNIRSHSIQPPQCDRNG